MEYECVPNLPHQNVSTCYLHDTASANWPFSWSSQFLFRMRISLYPFRMTYRPNHTVLIHIPQVQRRHTWRRVASHNSTSVPTQPRGMAQVHSLREPAAFSDSCDSWDGIAGRRPGTDSRPSCLRALPAPSGTARWPSTPRYGRPSTPASRSPPSSSALSDTPDSRWPRDATACTAGTPGSGAPPRCAARPIPASPGSRDSRGPRGWRGRWCSWHVCRPGRRRCWPCPRTHTSRRSSACGSGTSWPCCPRPDAASAPGDARTPQEWPGRGSPSRWACSRSCTRRWRTDSAPTARRSGAPGRPDSRGRTCADTPSGRHPRRAPCRRSRSGSRRSPCWEPGPVGRWPAGCPTSAARRAARWRVAGRAPVDACSRPDRAAPAPPPVAQCSRSGSRSWCKDTAPPPEDTPPSPRTDTSDRRCADSPWAQHRRRDSQLRSTGDTRSAWSWSPGRIWSSRSDSARADRWRDRSRPCAGSGYRAPPPPHRWPVRGSQSPAADPDRRFPCWRTDIAHLAHRNASPSWRDSFCRTSARTGLGLRHCQAICRTDR